MTGSLSSSIPQVATSDAYANVASSKERANLAQMVRSYQSQVNLGATPSLLRGAAKQITDAANNLGVTIALPTYAASNPSITDTAPRPASVQNDANKVDLTA